MRGSGSSYWTRRQRILHQNCTPAGVPSFARQGDLYKKKNISSVGFLTPLLLKQGVGGMSMRMLKKSQKLVCKNLNQYVKCVCMDVDAREGGRGST